MYFLLSIYNNFITIQQFKKNINNQINIKNIPVVPLNHNIITIKDTKPFTLGLTQGQVICVSNDYSILIACNIHSDNYTLYRFKIKFNNIVTPNVHGSYNEKILCNYAEKELTQLLLNKIVTLKNVNYKTYEEIFADVYVDNMCVNNWLINERYAVKNYIKPDNWLIYKMSGNYNSTFVN